MYRGILAICLLMNWQWFVFKVRLPIFIILIYYTNFSEQNVNLDSVGELGSRNDELYYVAPTFNLKNTTITFGSALFFSQATKQMSPLRIPEVIFSICQAELVNQKKTPFSIDGTINLIYQGYNSIQSSGQGAILDLISNSLYGSESNKLEVEFSEVIGGLMGSQEYGTARFNGLVVYGLGVPVLSAGNLARDFPDNIYGAETDYEHGNFQVCDTFEYDSFQAVLSTLNYLNWTLIGNVYVSNTYGFNRQRSVQKYSKDNFSPIFTCNVLVYVTEFEADTSALNEIIFSNYCTCITEKDKVSVTVLWMSTNTANYVIRMLRKVCPSSKDWTFLISDDFEPDDIGLLTPNNDNYILENTLLLRPFGNLNFKKFIDECRESSTPSVLALIDSLIDDYTLEIFNCQVSASENLPECKAKVDFNRRDPCHCDLSVLENNPYLAKHFFAADMVNIYAAAISLIQNNCSFLQEKLQSFENENFDLIDIDFCTLTSFTPLILKFAVKCVNITGYTGEINFPPSQNIRTNKTFYLYSVHNTSLDAVLVGTLNYTTVTINISSIQFVNGETPVSEIVPQNLNLSYAVVDVFFGVSIFGIIVCLIIFGFYIIHRKYSLIKRNAFWISLLILAGITLLCIGMLSLSFERTDAMCWISFYFIRFGLIFASTGLCAKNYRIYRIFSNRAALAIDLSEGKLLFYIMLVSLIYVGFPTVLFLTVGYEPILEQSDTNIYYQFINCMIPNSTWDLILKLFCEISLLIVIIAALILAWLTRRIQKEYQESKPLAAFSVIALAVSLVLIPLGRTLGKESDSELLRYVILVEFITVIIVSALGLLFLPKVYLILREKRRKHKVRHE